ncbi:MAG TPA: SurA N-terminal domain-containing protein [Clostridia bacterium]|nr:SurA N-terminal domain-containing protein [Clostridia bacterium]
MNKKTKKVAEEKIEPVLTEEVSITTVSKSISPVSRKNKNLFIVVALTIVIVGLLGYLFRDKFLAGIVNGRPIFRTELNQRLSQSYGKETLENMIIEKLIREEARKNNITVSDKEVEDEIAKLSQSLGEGTKLEDVLAQQRVSMKDFRNQITIRLEVNKLLDKETEVTDEEIDTFIKDNGDMLTATEEAEKRQEAQGIIKEQKLNERIQSWVSELLAKAKINRFLK